MSQLLSETSRMTRNHGELARAISELPRLTCGELRKETGTAYGAYLRSIRNELEPNSGDKIISAIRGISSATRLMLHYAINGDDEKSPPSVDHLFTPVHLIKGTESYHHVDTALQNILGRMSCTLAIPDNQITLYPMRIATGDDSLDLITEISRFEDVSTPGLAARHHSVTYSLSFAAYDA